MNTQWSLNTGEKLSKAPHETIYKGLCENFSDNIYRVLDNKKESNRIKNINKLSSKERQRRKNEAAKIERQSPILSILRLQENSAVLWIIFKNIKQANDKLWQRTVDIFLNKVQDIIYKNFSEKYPNERLVKKDYKNMIFNVRNEDWKKASKEIFGNDPYLILEEALQSMQVKKYAKMIAYKKHLLKMYKKWQININHWKKSFEEFVEKEINTELDINKIFWINAKEIDISEELQNIKDTLLKIDVGIWSSSVKSSYWEEKVQAIRKIEIASKNSSGELVEYDKNIVENNVRLALDAEKEIIEKYNNKTFKIKNDEFPVIIKDKINPTLLRFVRKWKEIEDKELSYLVENYINWLNNWLDFIFPTADNPQTAIKNAEWQIKLIDAYIEWKIPYLPDMLTRYNYKWTLTKECFLEELEWQNWLSVFVDIKDMWILNLLDFREIAGKFFENPKEKELLKSWKSVTERFFYLVEEIKREFKELNTDLQISLGWDEIYIFVKDNSNLSEEKIINTIKDKLAMKWMEWRITYDKLNGSWQNTYEHLDMSTLIIKQLEENIDKVQWKCYLESQDSEFIYQCKKWQFSNIDIKNIGKTNIDIEKIINIIRQHMSIYFEKFEKFLMWKDKNYKINQNDLDMKIIKNTHWLTLEIKKIKNEATD